MANPFQAGGFAHQKPSFGHTSQFGTSSGFGTTNQPSGFGSAGFGNSPSIGFGTNSSNATGGFGTGSSGGFGTTPSAGGFGTTPSAGGFGTTPSAGGFGTGSAGGFGTGSVGGFGTTPSGGGFGTSQSGSAFGTAQSGSAFGTAQPGSAFGTAQPGTANAFGSPQPGSGFGTEQSGSRFGTSQSGSGFGTSQSGSVFGAPASNTGSGFGVQSSSVFGGTSTASVFGGTSTASVFGGATGGTFGTQTGQSVFGTPTTTSSTFGGATFGTSVQGSFFGNVSKTVGLITGTSSTSTFGGGFGIGTTSSTFGGGFGNGTTPSAFGGCFGTGTTSSTFGSGFGTVTASSTFGGGFSTGTTSSTFGGGFGTGTTSGGVFGTGAHSSGFGSATTSAGGFGTGTTSSGFGNVSQGSIGFGTTTTQSTFGVSVFGVQSTKSEGTGTTLSPSTASFQSTTGWKGFGPGSGSFGVQSSTAAGMTGQTGTQSSSSSGVLGQTVAQSIGFGLQGQTSAQQSSSFGGTATSTSSAGLFGASIPRQSTSADGQAGGSSSILGAGEQKFDSSRNLFGKPELKIKPHITELSPPSTVLNPVTSPGTVFGGASKVTEGKNPLFSGTTSSASTVGLFGKPINNDHDDTGEKQKGSSKKMLFGKPVETKAATRRRSFDQPGTSRDSFDQSSKRKPSKENEEEPQSKKPIRRMSSTTDEMSSRVAIVCNNVPNKYNNVFFMRKHFSRFGEVVKVFPNTTKYRTTVHFKTHEAAKEAKSRGKILERGVRQIEIFWGAYTTPSPRRRSSDEMADSSFGKKRTLATDRPATKRDKFKWARNDLDDELASMSGTRDVNREQMKIVDRPDDLKASSSRSSLIDSPVRHSSPGPSTSKLAISEPTTVDKGSIAVLRSTVCYTSADKLQILSLRDKMVRLGMKKSANLKSKAFAGTCTDMCPERERYDREEKRRLHVYETLNPGSQNPQVDHSRAVKEYSRSSADQEEPLPHELRPLPTLVMTMNYLLSEIADKGEDGKWGDWFDFLWDRTRGIRKDITQQQLTTPESVELLEKCVRFHIFCSERLCEEDMHTFDLKINSENMTKCLQTLKEFYHDLETKQNTFCRNEAEMRSYMVLMNLNEGDILRETQQLRPEVRNTQHINFAIQVHSALNSNNFVRFFKLVKMAPFLPACIMHRYFTQMRTKALLTLLKAYRPKSHYSLSSMVRILGFETKIEAKYFCKFHGLNVTDEFVVLDKTSYVEPEESWLPRRSQTLIESKLVCSVGETINGEALPAFTLPQPSNSFDENNRFIGKLDVNVTDITETDIKPVITEKTQPSTSQQQTIPITEIKQEVKPQKIQFTNDDVKDIAKHLFWEVIGDMAKELSEDLVQGAKMMATQTQNICDDIVEEVVNEYVRSLSQSYHTEVTLLKQKKDKEMMIQSSAVHFTSVIIKDIVDQEVLNLATAEVREIKAQLKKEQIERCNAIILEELSDLTVNEMLEEVAEEVYQKDVVERLEELEDICHCIEVQRAGKYLKIWKKEFTARIKLKRSMLEFPPSCAMESNYDQVKQLIPARQNDVCDNNGFYVNKLAKLKIDTPDRDLANSWVVDRMLSAHELYRKICHFKAWQPLDIAAVAGSHLQKHFTRCMFRTFYWKLVLSFPDVKSSKCREERETTSLLNKWLRSKFTKGKDEMSPSSSEEVILSLYRTKLPYNHSTRVGDLGVCIRSAADKDLSHGDMLGCNGVIFVLPSGITENLSSNYWNDARKRLQTLLQLKPLYPPIPLVIMVPLLASEDFDDLIYTGLDIPYYLDEDLISSVYLRTVDLMDDGMLDVTQPELGEELCECVQWLADAYPPQPELRVKFLKDFIDELLLEKFFQPVLHNLKLRKSKGFLHQFPEQLVQLYNHVISHMTTVLTSDKLRDQSWPISEFFSADNPDQGIPPSHWNSEDHLDYIEQVIDKLQLPWFLNDDFEKDDWSDVCEVVWEYIDKVADDSDGQAKVDLASKIRLILKKTEEDFADICYLVEGETRCEPSSENIPWTDVITACLDYKISVINFQDLQIDKNIDLMAVYFKKDLKDYRPPDSWKYFESDKDINVTTSMKSSVQVAKIKSKAKKVEQSLISEPDILPKTLNHAAIDLEIVPESILTAKKISQSLANDLKKELSENQKYEQFLQNALMGGDLDSTDMPNISGLPPWSVFDSPNKTVSGDHSLVESLSEPLISDEVDRLKREIDSNRRASDMFENQLRQWLGNPV